MEVGADFVNVDISDYGSSNFPILFLKSLHFVKGSEKI